MPRTANLKNAVLTDNRLHGQIYDDSTGEFPDATYITTSHIGRRTGTQFTTKSGSTYTVLSWAGAVDYAARREAHLSLMADEEVTLARAFQRLSFANAAYDPAREEKMEAKTIAPLYIEQAFNLMNTGEAKAFFAALRNLFPEEFV